MPGTYAVHADLYDGGGKEAIPFNKLVSFFSENLGSGFLCKNEKASCQIVAYSHRDV